MNTTVTERPIIAMDAVESSQIAAIGHDPETNTLAIRFPSKTGSGSVYHYSNFTAQLFEDFKNAESKGSHFGKLIKPFREQFPFENVTEHYAAQATEAATNESEIPAAQPVQDSLFARVPEITLRGSGIVVPAFQIAQYLASADAEGKLYISATDKPVVEINFYDAIRKADEAGMPLITDLQGLALAQNIIEQPGNWKSGVVGQGDLYQGMRNYSVDEAQRNDYEPADPDERRWFVLSTGERIFDPAGHLYTWCRATIEGDPETGLVNRPFAEDSPNVITSPYPSMEKGVGWTPSAGMDWSGFALLRGGCFASFDYAGVFTLYLGWPDHEYGYVGVRCTKPDGI